MYRPLVAVLFLGAVPAVARAADGGFDAHGFTLSAFGSDPRSPLVVTAPGRFSAWQWYAGGLLEYAKEPLVLYQYEGDELVAETPVLDDLLAANLSAGFALHDRVRLDVGLPLYLSSSGADGTPQGFAPGDLHVAAFVALVRPAEGDAPGAGLGLVPFVDVPTGDEAAWLGQSGPGGGAKLSGGWSGREVSLGLEVGASFQPEIAVGNLRGADRLLLGGNVGFLLDPSLGLNAEMHAGLPFSTNEELGSDAPAEVLVSLRKRMDSGAHLTMGAATALSKGASAADFRVFLGGGFGAAPGPRDVDRDGLADSADRCPEQPETVNGRADDDGCPDTLSAVAVKVTRDGEVVEGAVLTVRGPGGVREVTTGVAPYVFDTNQGEAWAFAAAQGACLRGEATVTAGEGRTEALVELRPARGASATVVVVDAAGQPVPDARTTWTGGDPACVSGEAGAAGVAQPAAPGSYSVQVSAPGYKPKVVEVTLAAGDARELRVTLDPARAAVVGAQIVINTPIFFDVGKDSIRADSLPVLEDVLEILRKHPEFTKIEIAGHTDSDGGEAANLSLSQRRVESVRRWFIQRGIEPDRMVARGYGESQPIDTNATEDGRARNRRVEFNILTRSDGGAAMPGAPGPVDAKPASPR